MLNYQCKVDVIIPCYNNAEYVGVAIQSVLDQTCRPDTIIVIDDASTDNTGRILAEFGNSIKVINHKNNKGVSAARNTGIINSHSELIAFLDSDDVWDCNKIELQHREFLSDNKLGFSFTSLVDCDPSLKPIDSPRSMRRRISEYVFDELYERPFSIPLSTVMVRRNALECCGGFDESMKGVEDYELWLRISMLYPVSCIDKPLCFRRLHSGGISANYIQGEKLDLELKAIERCGKFAEEKGRSLPITVEERKIYSIRRRMKLAARWNDMCGVSFYSRKLKELDQYRLMDKLLFLMSVTFSPIRELFAKMKVNRT
jgi:glycosyltransferase involved in cell wall biosynthesis